MIYALIGKASDKPFFKDIMESLASLVTLFRAFLSKYQAKVAFPCVEFANRHKVEIFNNPRNDAACLQDRCH